MNILNELYELSSEFDELSGVESQLLSLLEIIIDSMSDSAITQEMANHFVNVLHLMEQALNTHNKDFEKLTARLGQISVMLKNGYTQEKVLKWGGSSYEQLT
jgi:hypothetical protein